MTECRPNVVIPVNRASRRAEAWVVAAIALVAMPAAAEEARTSPLAIPAASTQTERSGVAVSREEVVAFAALLDIDLPSLADTESLRLPDSHQIGVGRPIPKSHAGDIVDQLVWLTAPSGDLVTTLRITSSGAEALRVALRGALPGEASLRFLAPTGEGQAHVASRRYTRNDFADGRAPDLPGLGRASGELDGSRTVWSPILYGHAAGVEIVLPRGTSIADLALQVVGISHFDALSADRLGRADEHVACPAIDVLCSDAPQCELNAALRLTFTDPVGNSYSCSATAVNDSRPLDEKLAAPSVLTSHRCLSSAYNVETVIANWHQRSTVCDGGNLTNRYRELSGGAELLASHPESNHTLLRLRDPVPKETDHCLAGWSTAEDILTSTAFAIHHGASGFKEWAEGEITAKTDFTLEDGQAVTGYKIDVAEGALWDGSAGAGWFIERDGETNYVGVQSKVSGENCGVASAGSFAAFFDAAGSAHLGEGVDRDDHGDSVEDATFVDLGTSGTAASEGTIAPGGDADVFRIDVSSPGILTAYTRGDIDTVGDLFAADDEQIAHDDDGGAGSNFRLVADLTPGAYWVRVRAFEETTGDYTLVVTFAEHAVPRTLSYSIPLFLPVGDSNREGFLRVVNNSDSAGTVDVTAIDDLGRSRGPVTLTLGERETVHLNSGDLERGNASKGLSAGVGDGNGNWRLRLESSLHLTPQAFARTNDGFVTSMHDVVGHVGRSHRVAFFNPGSNVDQRSVLRLVNPTPDRVRVTITGRDDSGQRAPGGDVRLMLAGAASTILTSQQLEAGTTAATGRLGDGVGKWELAVEADGDILAISLLETPTGHLTNLSTINPAHEIPLFLAAGGAREGFLRIINNSNRAGSVRITATDAAGVEHRPVRFALGPRSAKHFNSSDLENGNAAKGLTDRLGDGRGSWHLAFSSDLDITAQAYVRTTDGFVTSMHEQVPLTGLTHDVAFFNPGSNQNQRSWLQLTNLEDREVGIAIEALDDAGDPGLRPVIMTIDPGAVRVVSAEALEVGDLSLRGRFGTGTGKWQLALSANGRIEVVNLLETPTGHLANLSTIAAKPFERAFNDVFIEPEETEMVAVDGVTVEAALNQILVFLDHDVTSAELRAIEAAIDAQAGRRLALNTRLRTLQVGIDDDVDESAFIETLSAVSGVHSAGVNPVLAPDRNAMPVRPRDFVGEGLVPSRAVRAYTPRPGDHRGRPYGFRAIGLNPRAPATAVFPGDYWVDHINAESAWQALAGITLHDSPLGIVDTGLAGSQTVVEEYRLTRYTAAGSPSGGYFGTSSHGLWATGFAAGRHQGDQRGVNPHSDVLLVDVEKRGVVYESALLSGIQTAIDNGAKVVNVSFGATTECADARLDRLVARERWRRSATNVLDFARQRNALVVWSAGSDCEKTDDRYLPVSADLASRTHAWESHALIVGASTMQRADACFSRMGDVVDLMAPGQAVAFAPGRPLLDGTSYAAPLVAGAAGLVRAVDHTLSAPETKAILLASSSASIKPQTMAMNDTQCAARYPAGVTADNRPGAATTPEDLLNLGTAVESAVVAAGVPLVNGPIVMLSRGARAQIPIEVSVPSTGVIGLDVVFLVDQTGSFDDDVETLQEDANVIIEEINSRGVDASFGVAGFGDYSADAGSQTVFTLYQDITDNVKATIAALDELGSPLLRGGDAPEAQYEALYRATKEFSWRTGALRVILLATDAPFHDSDTEADYPGTGREAVLALLQREDVVVIGLQRGDNADAQNQLRELALATGGNVQELDTSSSEIADAIEDGLDEALALVDVQLEVIAGSPWVLGVTPFARRGVSGGETVTFTVHLEGILDNSIDPISQDIYAWAWADGSGLVGRARIPVVVPSEPFWRLSAASP